MLSEYEKMKIDIKYVLYGYRSICTNMNIVCISQVNMLLGFMLIKRECYV